MNPALRELIAEAACEIINYHDATIDVFELLNRYDVEAHEIGAVLAACLDKLVHTMRQRYHKTIEEAEAKCARVASRDPAHEYYVRRTSMAKFVVAQRPLSE